MNDLAVFSLLLNQAPNHLKAAFAALFVFLDDSTLICYLAPRRMPLALRLPLEALPRPMLYQGMAHNISPAVRALDENTIALEIVMTIEFREGGFRITVLANDFHMQAAFGRRGIPASNKLVAAGIRASN